MSINCLSKARPLRKDFYSPGWLQARTVAYRHWAYPDEDVSKADSSIMMAIKLRAGQVKTLTPSIDLIGSVLLRPCLS